MKVTKISLFYLFIILFVFACQKEITESLIASSGTLVHDAAGNCVASTVNGNYVQGDSLNSTNNVQVQINFASAGSYNIQSDTLNGYSFSGSGNIPSPGSHSIQLAGSGRPVTSGINTFTISFDTSFCYITVPVTSSPVGAIFTVGNGSICTGAVINGTYITNVPISSFNTVAINVNVTRIGAYTINTNNANGLSFSANGNFTSLGAQNITLSATGTPTLAGSHNFTITSTGTNNSCVFSVNTGTSAPINAVYTLATSSGNCTGFVASGPFVAGTPTNNSNTVTLNVNVTTPGVYSLTSSSVNGVSFNGAGNFSSTGAQTVTLTATGTPAIAGTNNYSLTANSSTCAFTITATAPTSAAMFALMGAGSNCTGFTVAGNYVAGLATTSANRITVNVNVSTPGTYNLVSNTLNGVSFSASGSFTVAGPQTIILNATGTPLAPGLFNFSLPNNATSCTFPITFTASGNNPFTLGGSGGTCTGVVLTGVYSLGLDMNSSHTVTINVNVANVGPYTISTNTVNGVTFSKSGTFTTTGAQTVVLIGSGSPSSFGNMLYTVTVPGSSCTFSITFGQPALFTLMPNINNSCMNGTPQGVYTAGVPLTSANTISFQVNVQLLQSGVYNIWANNATSGMSFVKTGIFTSTGIQMVTITGTGTPAAAGAYTMTVGTWGSQTCTIVITVN